MYFSGYAPFSLDCGDVIPFFVGSEVISAFSRERRDAGAVTK